MMMMALWNQAVLAARVGEPALAADLEEQIEDRRVRLLDLVEEEHAEGLLADAPREQALGALGAADQPLGGVRRHELAHVEADQPLRRAEEERRPAARASSVLPTPVGPTKRNVASGLPAGCRPALTTHDASPRRGARPAPGR